jgi:hypothetical protein
MDHSAIINFVSKFSADLYGSAESAGVLLFLERSKFEMNFKQAAPLTTKINGHKCIFQYTPQFVDMPYDAQAFYTLSEMYKIMHLHVLRERSLKYFYEDDFSKDLFDQASEQVANNEATFFKRVFAFDSINDIQEISRRKKEDDEDVESVYDNLFADKEDEEQEGQDQQDEDGEDDQEGQDGSQGSSNEEGSGEKQESEKGSTDDSTGSRELEQRIQETLNFVNDLKKEPEFEGFESEDGDSGKKAGNGEEDNIFQYDVKAVPTFSKTWTKIIKWQIAKSKRQDMDLECNWTNMNPRNAWLNTSGLILPQEKLKVTDSKSPAFWVFIDVSSSCEQLWPSFYQIIRSVPREFKVRFFHFAERCKEITKEVKQKNFKLSKNSGVGYGTSFASIENRIQETMRNEKTSYPDYVVVITDGEGEAVYNRAFQHPERWMFILDPRPMSWSRYEKAYVLSKDQDGQGGALRLCSFQYIDRLRKCPFWETRNDRPKHLPLTVNYKEFLNPGKYSYELHDQTDV